MENFVLGYRNMLTVEKTLYIFITPFRNISKVWDQHLFLFSQLKLALKHLRQGSTFYSYDSEPISSHNRLLPNQGYFSWSRLWLSTSVTGRWVKFDFNKWIKGPELVFSSQCLWKLSTGTGTGYCPCFSHPFWSKLCVELIRGSLFLLCLYLGGEKLCRMKHDFTVSWY